MRRQRLRPICGRRTSSWGLWGRLVRPMLLDWDLLWSALKLVRRVWRAENVASRGLWGLWNLWATRLLRARHRGLLRLARLGFVLAFLTHCLSSKHCRRLLCGVDCAMARDHHDGIHDGRRRLLMRRLDQAQVFCSNWIW